MREKGRQLFIRRHKGQSDGEVGGGGGWGKGDGVFIRIWHFKTNYLE